MISVGRVQLPLPLIVAFLQGQRPRGTGLQELKGGAPPVDMDRKAAYRRELEVQIREQQARRDVQKLEAKVCDHTLL